MFLHLTCQGEILTLLLDQSPPVCQYQQLCLRTSAHGVEAHGTIPGNDYVAKFAGGNIHKFHKIPLSNLMQDEIFQSTKLQVQRENTYTTLVFPYLYEP